MKFDKDFYSEILENLKVGIFVLDAKGNYLYVNETYCKMVNKTPEFYDNMSIPKLKERGYLTVSVWEQVLQKNGPVVSLVTITDKDPSRVYKSFTTAIPTFNADGSIKYIYYLVEPIESMNQRIQAGILNKQYGGEVHSVNEVPDIDIIAESPKMKQLLVLLSNVAKTDASILISGPTGSGKEVLAEYAHFISTRGNEPFISVDCASIPENLLESELFGYEKGAFTGASVQGKRGQIESANGGTLFLDEINSMPLGIQGKLLRVLETRKVKPLGSLEAKPIDFRLICASNENLETLVQNGGFRSDLYYRINVVPVQIPPLCERKEDIPPLAFSFLQFFCKKHSRMKIFTEDLINVMLSYDWPGNVRELRNFVERMVVTSPDTDIQVESIPNNILQCTLNERESDYNAISYEQKHLLRYQEDNFSYNAYMAQCEKFLMQNALAKYKTPAKVAEVLDLNLSSVYRKIQKFGL